MQRSWKVNLPKDNSNIKLIEISFSNPEQISVVQCEYDIDENYCNYSTLQTAWRLAHPTTHPYHCVITYFCGDFGGTHNPRAVYHQPVRY